MIDRKKNKNLFYMRMNQIIASSDFTFDRKQFGGADLEFVLGHYLSDRPIGECKARLKSQFKIDDATINKLMTRMSNMVEALDKEIEAKEKKK